MPAPPPPEHLQRLRVPGPVRARIAARRRPSLAPVAKSWVANLPRTATSRWRAIAATVLGGGSGRESRLDAMELAAPAVPALPAPEEAATPPENAAPHAESAAPPLEHGGLPEEVVALPAYDAKLPPGPNGTVRTPAREVDSQRRLPSKTLKLVARPAPKPALPVPANGEAARPGTESAAYHVADVRRAALRRWIVGVCVALLGGWIAWFVLRGHGAEPSAAAAALPAAPVTATASAPALQAQSAPAPPATTASPAMPDPQTAPALSPAPAGKRSLRQRTPRRASDVF